MEFSKTSKIIFYILGFLILFYLALSFIYQKNYTKNTEPIVFSENIFVGGVGVKVGIAETEEERRIGLSGQKNLEKNHGLLFIFNPPEPSGIWMKEMNFPIDVIWFDENRKIIHLKENFLPSSYPEVEVPPARAQFILEVPAGFILEHKISLNDKLFFVGSSQ